MMTRHIPKIFIFVSPQNRNLRQNISRKITPDTTIKSSHEHTHTYGSHPQLLHKQTEFIISCKRGRASLHEDLVNLKVILPRSRQFVRGKNRENAFFGKWKGLSEKCGYNLFSLMERAAKVEVDRLRQVSSSKVTVNCSNCTVVQEYLLYSVRVMRYVYSRSLF